MLLSDWLKAGVEGKTVDGRAIQREWLERAAALYSPETYTANLNSEHFFFPGLGWVAEVKAEEDEQQRMALWVKLVPTAELLTRNQSKRQLFFSMELTPGFPAEGDWYLTGLAVTDMPASQGLAPQLFKAGKNKAERFYNTAELELTERGLWASARNPQEQGASPAPVAEDQTPPWASRFLASMRALLRAGATSAESETTMLTKEECKELDDLKAAIKAIEESVAKLPAQPGADALAELVKNAVAEQIKPLSEKVEAFDAFLNETRATEALEVHGTEEPQPGQMIW